MEKKEEKVQEQPKKSKMEELDEEAKKQARQEGEQDLGSHDAAERQSDSE